MAGSFIRGMKIVVDHGTQAARVVPPDGAPAWWKTELYIDHGNKTVRATMLGVVATFECLDLLGNYGTTSGGVDVVYDIDGTRVGQRIFLVPRLPSTNDHVHVVTLAGYTGDARTLTLGHYNIEPDAAFDNRVGRVVVFLKQGATEVAPVVGGVYTFEVRFHQFPV